MSDREVVQAEGRPVPSHKAYSSIVEGEHDIVGLVGYSLYKRDKLAFKAKQMDDTGNDPTPQEMMAFCRGATLPGPVGAYRAQATLLLQQMYDDLLTVQVTEVEEKYNAKLLEELKKAHPFWESVWEHVVAGIVLLAIGGLVVVIYYGQHVGFKQMFSNIFNMPAAESKHTP